MSYPVFTVFAGDVVPIFFGSYAGATGASAAMTGLAVTDIEIYKDGSVTQRASDAGYTLLDTDGLDFDGITGINGFSIDTGDNTDAGFYTVGAWFTVVVSAVTVDSQTVSFIAAQFRIVAAEAIAGVPKVDQHAISGDTTAADNLETMLDGTGGQNLTLARLVADNSAGSGPGIYAKGGDSEAGMELVGTGSGAGLRASGGATGNGVIVNGGGSSYGMAINSASGGLAALALIGTGAEPGLSILAGPTGHGVLVTGGSTSGDGIRAEVTSGAPFRGDLTGNVTGTGSFIPSYKSPDANGLTDNATPFWMVGASGVELEVDTETGRVRLTRLINVADVGTPINPRIVETQLSGASIMQLGFTLLEKMQFDARGQLRNASLAEYRIPGLLDLPGSIISEAVVAEQKSGPFGAKGVGETATFGVSPAIANAVHDAVGVRLTSLPLSAEAIFEALARQ